MTYKELYNKIQSGEITLPVTVKIVERLCDEFELDEGCKAKLIHLSKRDEDRFKIHFDYSKFLEYNKTFWKYNYYDDNHNPILAIWQTKWFSGDNGKCDCYVEADYEIQFEIIEDKRIIEFESTLISNGYEQTDISTYIPNTTLEDIGKRVKVTIEFLED